MALVQNVNISLAAHTAPHTITMMKAEIVQKQAVAQRRCSTQCMFGRPENVCRLAREQGARPANSTCTTERRAQLGTAEAVCGAKTRQGLRAGDRTLAFADAVGSLDLLSSSHFAQTAASSDYVVLARGRPKLQLLLAPSRVMVGLCIIESEPNLPMLLSRDPAEVPSARQIPLSFATAVHGCPRATHICVIALSQRGRLCRAA